jgi:ParB family chromosome partitioning protein
MMAKQALGRGLKALIPETPLARAGLVEIPLDRLLPNPEQPRRFFDESSLEELAESIRRHGLLQPLLVSEAGAGGYVVIAGERRWRAARKAGLDKVPAVVREQLTAREDLALALVENLQRRDLTPLEEARAFEHLRSEYGLSQAEIAEQVGWNRSTVANALRLLRLPESIQGLVESGSLSAGHGRALLSFSSDQECLDWAERAAAEGLSVRDLERAAKAAGTTARATDTRRVPPPKDPNLVAAEEKLSLKLGAPVEIRSRRRGGAIVITCRAQGDLMRVFDLLMGGE